MKAFMTPEIEVILMDAQDVITTSFEYIPGEDETPVVPAQ